jgi:hypothetical protein
VRSQDELPFNLRSLRNIPYESTVAGMKALRKSLAMAIHEFLAVSRIDERLSENGAL